MVRTLLLAGMMSVSAALSAQDTLKLTLSQSLDIALNDNPTIKIADMEIERQEYVRKETVGNLLPNLSASGSYNRAIKKTTIDAGGGQKFSFEPDNTVVGAVSLSLPLFAPAVYRTLKLNDEQMRAAVETARASKITLTNEVRKAFYNILLAQRSLDVLRSSEANIEETVRQTRAMLAQKMASEYDLLTVEVQLSNLQPTIIQTVNSIKTAKQLLKMYLYLPQELEIAVEGYLADFEIEALGMDLMMAPDLSNNSEVVQLGIQKNILEQQLKLARTSRMPTLAAVSNFQVMGRDKISFALGGEGANPSTSKKFELQTPLSAGVQLSVPIFAGLSRTNKERQIKNSIEQLQLQRDYLDQSVNLEAKTVINNIITAKAQMDATSKTVAQADKGYTIAKTRYYNGLGTILEVNTAELSLTQAKLNYSQSLYDLLSAQAEYNKVLGKQ